MPTLTNYDWNPIDDCVMAETNAAGNTIVTYTHEPGQFGPLLSEHRSTGWAGLSVDGWSQMGVDDWGNLSSAGESEYYHHYDALGSTVLLTDDSATVTDTFLYDACGNLVTRTGTTATPYQWVGRWGYSFDIATNSLHVRSRVYDSDTLRWRSRDPLGFAAGINLFRYSANRPIDYADPAGEDWLDFTANYAAGIGDSLTFGITDLVRNKMDWNGGIDHSSAAYVSGMATEIVAEGIVSCGGTILRRGALKVTASIADKLRKTARQLVPATQRWYTRLTRVGSGAVHHINTIIGHPPLRNIVYNRFGLRIAFQLPRWMSSGRSTRSLFPMPTWLVNKSWNLVRVEAEYHRFMHFSALVAERIAYSQTTSVAIAVKATLNVRRSCCDPPLQESEAVDFSFDVDVQAKRVTEQSQSTGVP